MWWESGADGKESEAGGSSDNIPITPVLVPSQSTPTIRQPSPMPIVVPDVQDLKEQFQKQQSIITQIKETLKQNESQLSSKEKQVEAYATRLSQIKARSKTKSSEVTTASPVRRGSKENLKDEGKGKLSAKGKVNELKKRVEENKIKFEERTGKELSDTKKIESLVEHLQKQLEDRDVTIQDLRKTIETPPKKADTLPRRKNKENCASKSTQTSQAPTSETLDLQTKIYELETSVMDLNESLKEKESVIEARTQAVTLLTQDLSMKGKNTLDNLEETRQEMRAMQSNFVVIQDQLQRELLEKEEKLTQYEEKNKKLESTNFDLSLKNAELQEKLVNLQSRNGELESEIKNLKESVASDERLEEMTKKIEILTKELEDSNKSMIKMKLDHKNKIKTLNKTLEKVSKTSDDKAEMIRLEKKLEELESIKEKLENKLIELEEEKGNLLLSVLDVDDFKASETRLNDQITELQAKIREQSDDLDSHLKVITNLEADKFELMQANQDQNILIENLYSKIQTLEGESQNILDLENNYKAEISELNSKLEALESDYNLRIEDLKTEHNKEIELVETFYNAKGEGVNKKELEEFRISNELNNIHVEEQIELLVREKQQLLEKLKNLSGVSSTDSLTFEKMEHSDLKDDKETTPTPDDYLSYDPNQPDESDNRLLHLTRLTSEQQIMITDLQNTLDEEKRKVTSYQTKIKELEETITNLQESNNKVQAQIEEKPSGTGPVKLNANTKNKIKKMQNELGENRRIVKEQTEKIKELNSKLEEKEELIKNYIEKIENFEKDDWGRENDWKKEDFDNVQELQKKCLSLENNLIELTEDCERLRKENIEIVHLLSEEKVQRKKLQEELDARQGKQEEERRLEMEQSVEVLAKSVGLEESVVEARESDKELQEKLEWTNVVLTSKETEIFRLQSLLEDQGKVIENLERDLRERNDKLGEILDELSAKELQLEEISTNFDRLKESVDVANQTIMTNEGQLKELLETVGRMEEDVSKKENELKEIKGILAEKNLDMTNLRERLEEVNSDLTVSYQEHLENMRKCLRDKQSEYEELLSEKVHLEELNKNLVLDKEELYNQKIEMLRRNEELENLVQEKERVINEVKGSSDIEELKTRMKKLAANLKKKAQNEKDLIQQVKDLEECIAEKDKTTVQLNEELQVTREKWEIELSEKEQYKRDFEFVVNERDGLISANADLTERLVKIETEHRNSEEKNEYKFQQMETQLQKMYENSERCRIVQEQDRCTIDQLTSANSEKVAELQEVKNLHEEVVKMNDELRLECSRLREELEEQQRKYQEIEKTLGERDEMMKDIEGSWKNLQEQLQFVDEEKRNLMNRIDEQENVMLQLKRFEEEYNKTGEEKVTLLNQLEEQQNALEELSSQLKTATDAKETVSQELEQSLVEKVQLQEKLTELLEEKGQLEEKLKEKPVKRKSVTFRTDEVEYIKELKEQIHNYNKELKEAKGEIELLKMELLKENVKNAVTEVIIEAKEKVEVLKEQPKVESLAAVEMQNVQVKSGINAVPEMGQTESEIYEPVIESKVDGAPQFSVSSYFVTGTTPEEFLEFAEKQPPADPFNENFDSLAWDDDWGTDGHLEEQFQVETQPKFDPEIKRLQTELAELHLEKKELLELINKNQAEYSKKLKEQKSASDSLQSELNKLKNNAGFSDLDDAIIDELKSQIKELENRQGELTKELGNSKLEKENLLKRIEVLNAGNEKFLEMKERQDNETQLWELKNKELLRELAELRNRGENLVVSDGELAGENKELKNKLEGLEWELCELKELLEEKEEKLEELGRLEKNSSGDKELIEELQGQVAALASENESLQEILNSMKGEKKEGAKIFDYFKSAPADDFFAAQPSESEVLKKKEGREKELLENYESLQRELEAVSLCLKERNETCEKLQVRNSELEFLIEDLKSKLNENLKDDEKVKLEENVLILKGEVENLNRDLAEERIKLQQEREQSAWFQQEKANLEENVLILKAEIENLNRTLAEERNKSAQEHQNSAWSHQEKTRLEENILSLEAEVENLSRALAEERNKSAWSQQDVEKSAWSQQEKTQLEENILSLEAEIENLNRNLAEERNKSAWIQHEKDQILYQFQNKPELEENLEQNVLSLKSKIETLNKALTDERNLVAWLQQEKSNLEENLLSLKAEIENLSRDLTEERNKSAQLLTSGKSTLDENVSIFKTEMENLNKSLIEERNKTADLLYERDNHLQEILKLNNKLVEIENKFAQLLEEDSRQKQLTNEYSEFREELEKTAQSYQNELERAKFELSTTRRELEEIKTNKDDAILNLKTQLKELESELTEISERKEFELDQLKCELKERIGYYENLMESDKSKENEEVTYLRKQLYDLEKQLETLKSELKVKDEDIFEIGKLSEEEERQIGNLKEILEAKEEEIKDLKDTLRELQNEISHFRNFEKQVKELRQAQIRSQDSNAPVTSDGDPDLTDWSEHELAELNTRLQSDLDTALYMLHQRDVRCDELTFELMQLLEERDTLQLRLSTAIRINEEYKTKHTDGNISPVHDFQDHRNLGDQSNDQKTEPVHLPGEDLNQLQRKISELHSVGYIRDKTIRDDSVQRHREQMSLLGRVSDSDISLSRDVQSPPTVLLNWIKGKTTPKVMHI